MRRIDVTRQPLPLVMLQFFLLLGLFWFRYMVHPSDAEQLFYLAADGGESFPGDVWNPGAKLNLMAAGFPFIRELLTIAIVMVNAFTVTAAISRNLLYTARSYLPAIFYVCVCCGIYFPANDFSAVVSSFLLIKGCSCFMASFVRSHSFGITFRGAFLTGIIPLLHPVGVVYLLIIPVAMMIFQRTARETAVAIFGAFLPALIWSYGSWATGSGFMSVFENIRFAVMTPDHIPLIGEWDLMGISGIAAAGSFAFLLLLSMASFFGMSADMRTKAYKVQTFMIWCLLFGAAAMALPGRSAGDLTLLSVPAAFVAPAFFVKNRGRIPAIVYLVVIGTMVFLNIAPFVAG